MFSKDFTHILSLSLSHLFSLSHPLHPSVPLSLSLFLPLILLHSHCALNANKDWVDSRSNVHSCYVWWFYLFLKGIEFQETRIQAKLCLLQSVLIEIIKQN